MKITPDEFALWSRFIYDLTGIFLDASKIYLFETRLLRVLRETSSKSFSELYFKTKSDPSNLLSQKVIDVMTTNETSFFRDGSPFDVLRYKILPELIDRRMKTCHSNSPIPLRIWSAACSTGQEVYSIAIALHETISGNNGAFQVEILGTDISDSAIKKASRGSYSSFDLERGLPDLIKRKYFKESIDGFRIVDSIRALVLFKKINLIQPLVFSNSFDVIFCRNVAIYFSKQDQISLFSRLAEVLAPDGALIIGSTESLSGISSGFTAQRYHKTTYYQKNAFAQKQTPT